jgi:hypothetical protein
VCYNNIAGDSDQDHVSKENHANIELSSAVIYEDVSEKEYVETAPILGVEATKLSMKMSRLTVPVKTNV